MENEIKIILKYFNSGNYKRVVEKSQKLQKKYSQSSYLDNLLGSAYLKIGDNKNAKINFESSITKSPENIAALNNLANLEKNNGNYKSAQKIYLKILKLDQNYINALVNYANLKMDMGDSDGAIKTLLKAIAIDPSNSIVLFNLATAYLTLGQKTKSLKYALRSSEINPNFSSIDKLISVIKTYNKDDDHFIKMKNKLNDLNINQFSKIYLNFAIAKAYKDMGENRKFIEHIITGNALKKKISNYYIKLYQIILNKDIQ
jgi:tetratricopeptide (TPR) repeat protein